MTIRLPIYLLLILFSCKSPEIENSQALSNSAEAGYYDLKLYSADSYRSATGILTERKNRYIAEIEGTLDLSSESTNYLGTYEALTSSNDPQERVKGYLFLLDKIRHDPVTVFRQLRTYKPVLSMPEIGFTLVTRNTDVRDMLHKPHVYTVGEYAFRMETAIDQYMLSRDTAPKPGISRLSQYSTENAWREDGPNSFFNVYEKKMMRQAVPQSDYLRFQSIVREETQREIAKIKASGKSFDVVRDISRVVPIRIVQRYFGLTAPLEKQQSWSYRHQDSYFHNARLLPAHLQKAGLDFSKYAGMTAKEINAQGLDKILSRLEGIYAAVKTSGADPGFVENLKVHIAGIGAGLEMKVFLASILDEPNKVPEGTVFAKLLAKKGEIQAGLQRANIPKNAVDRIIAQMIGGLVGTNETANQGVTHSLNQIFTKPNLLSKAVEAAANTDPNALIHGTKLSKIVWEALRFHPINPFVVRNVSASASAAERTVRGVEIPAGTRVLISTASAMLDPRTVFNPEAFRGERSKYDRDMNLGYSLHRCLGDHIAEVMVPEIVRQILLLPGIQKIASKSPDPKAVTLGLDYGSQNYWPVSSETGSDNRCSDCIFGKKYPVLRAGSFPQSLFLSYQ